MALDRKEYLRNYAREWRKKNKERHLEYTKKWEAENREKRNKQKIELNSKNREQYNKLTRDYRAKNSDRTRKNHREWCKMNPEKIKKSKQKCAPKAKITNKIRQLKKNFGLDFADYLKMADDQNQKCGICGRNFWEFYKYPAVDHDHKTGEIRGLLCGDCNVALGGFKDDLGIIQNASNYLIKAEG